MDSWEMPIKKTFLAHDGRSRHLDIMFQQQWRGKGEVKIKKVPKPKQGHGRKPGADETVAGKPVHAPPNGVGLSGS
jgi:hypothetical protein